MKNTFSQDLVASIVVFLVALPLCMGISIASGVPPGVGLITGIIGGIVVGTLAGSPLQVSGPAAGLAVIVWEIIQSHGIKALGPVLLIAGAVQLIAGVLRIGGWFRAMSPAVVHGMLAGIGVLIFASQFHVMLDDKPKSSGIANILSMWPAVWGGIFPLDGSPHELAAVVGIITIATVLLWNRFRPRALQLVPGALAGVLVATTVAAVLGWPVQRVNVPSNLSDVVSLPSYAWLKSLRDPGVLFSGLVVAFIASAETLLSAAAVDRMQSRARANYDKELRSQGIGNMLCGLLGALPMTGVIVRSSANVQAGAQTRLATIMHGAWLLAFTAGLPWLLRTIPTSCLGALLVYTGAKLVDRKNIRHLAGYGKFPVFIYAVTVIGIVCEDLLTGVLLGVGLTVVKLIYKLTRLDIVKMPGAEPDEVDIYLRGSATFIKIPQLAAALESIPDNSQVCIHLQNLLYIDHSCLDLLYESRNQLNERGVQLHVEWEGLRERFERPVGSTAGPAASSTEDLPGLIVRG